MVYCEAENCLWQNSDDRRIHRVFRGRPSAHLMADTEEELITYARSVGLRDSWIQHPGTNRVHYDITGARLIRVLRDSRVEKLQLREMVLRVKNKRPVFIT